MGPRSGRATVLNQFTAVGGVATEWAPQHRFQGAFARIPQGIADVSSSPLEP
jgi:hypothetical protein